MNPFSAVWHDAILRPLVWLLSQLHDFFSRGTPTERAGSFGLAIVAVTLLIRIALAPLAVTLAFQGRRTAVWTQRRRSAEMLLRQLLADDPAQLQKELAVLRRWNRRHLAARILTSPLSFASVAVQFLIVVALYYAIADVAHQLAPGDLAFGGIGNITHTALDVCCTTMRDGQPVLDAAGAPQHGDYLAGVLHNPGAMALPLLAALLSVVQSVLPQRRIPTGIPVEQQRAARAARQTSMAPPLLMLIAAVALPEAIALALVTQTACLIVQAAALRRWFSRPRSAQAGGLVAAGSAVA